MYGPSNTCKTSNKIQQPSWVERHDDKESSANNTKEKLDVERIIQNNNGDDGPACLVRRYVFRSVHEAW